MLFRKMTSLSLLVVMLGMLAACGQKPPTELQQIDGNYLEYNDKNLLVKETIKNQKMEDDYCVTYEYNDLDQIIRSTYYDLSRNEHSEELTDEDHMLGYIDYRYDSDGNLESGLFWSKASDYHPVYTFSYNSEGKLNHQGHVVENGHHPYRKFTYDENGNLSKEELYEYYSLHGDELTWTEIFDNERLVLRESYYYDPINDIESTETTRCIFDEQGNISLIEDSFWDTKCQYEYDNKGRLKKCTETALSDGREVCKYIYKYGVLGRIKQCLATFEDESIQYDYKTRGNVITVNYKEKYADKSEEKGQAASIVFGKDGTIVRWEEEEEFPYVMEYDHMAHEVKQSLLNTDDEPVAVVDTIYDYYGNLICVMVSANGVLKLMDGYEGLFEHAYYVWYKEILPLFPQWAPFVNELFFKK